MARTANLKKKQKKEIFQFVDQLLSTKSKEVYAWSLFLSSHEWVKNDDIISVLKGEYITFDLFDYIDHVNVDRDTVFEMLLEFSTGKSIDSMYEIFTIIMNKAGWNVVSRKTNNTD